MKLNQSVESTKKQWKAVGYSVPEFDRDTIAKNTYENPEWIHFGAGNIFRAFQANVVQTLLNEGILHTGLIVAEGYDYEILTKMNQPHDEYSILVTLKADGTIEKTVVASVMESLTVDQENAKDFARLVQIFQADSLKMVSFTITEKGYSLRDGQGKIQEAVQQDREQGPKNVQSYMGKVTALLYERFQSGRKPLALVSMDNCSHNGDKLYAAVAEIATAWEEQGLVTNGFTTYIKDPDYVSFPWTMIDKITPRPDDSVRALLEQDGIYGLEQVVTSKHTYVAPFVNAEEPQYLIMEDAFPNGRLPLDQGGIIYTTKEVVDQVERMKVCTCLNPLHTALAIYGCLMGYELISKEMENPLLKKLVHRIGYDEGLNVVVDPGILCPKDFIDEVIEVRLPNPFMPDSPQRIATDTSQKMPIRFGETIKAYAKSAELKVSDLVGIPLVIAGWLRYLCGVDDYGNEMSLSSDPRMEELQSALREIEFGNPQSIERHLVPLLSDKTLFGVNLYDVGLGERIEGLFAELIEGPGAVVKTLAKYVK